MLGIGRPPGLLVRMQTGRLVLASISGRFPAAPTQVGFGRVRGRVVSLGCGRAPLAPGLFRNLRASWLGWAVGFGGFASQVL